MKFVDDIQGSGRGKKFYQLSAIDGCTRLRVLRLYPNCDMKTALGFYDYTTSRLPFKIGRVQTDNGSKFQSAFHLHLLDGVIIDDTNLFNDKLQEWEDCYNYHLPHGGIAGQTPY